MRMENTVKLNGVDLDIIKLQLFPFSVRDVAASWFELMPYAIGYSYFHYTMHALAHIDNLYFHTRFMPTKFLGPLLGIRHFTNIDTK